MAEYNDSGSLATGLGSLGAGVLARMFGVPTDLAMGLAGVLREELGTSQANADTNLRYGQAMNLYGFDPETGSFSGGAYGRAQRSLMDEAGMYNQGLRGISAGYNSDMFGLAGDIRGQTARQMQGYGDLGSQIGGGYGQLGTDLMGGYGGLRSDASMGGSGLLGMAQSGYGGLTSGYGSRQNDVMGLLSGMGNAERQDIQQRYGDLAGAQQQQLAASGLSGTTIGSNLAAGRARDMTREMGGLDERLRNQAAGYLTQLSGDTLGARERGLTAGLGIGQTNLDRELGYGAAGLGAQERMGSAGLGAQMGIGLSGLGAQERWYGAQNAQEQQRINQIMGLGQQGLAYNAGNMAEGRNIGLGMSNEMLNLLGGKQNIIPSSGGWQNLGSILAANNVQQPQSNWYDGIVGPAAGAAGAIGTAGILSSMGGGLAVGKAFMFCIDADAKIRTPNGESTLSEIMLGDTVINVNGEPTIVIGRAYGPSDQDGKEYVRIVAPDGREIVCTKDHIIEGRTAGDWYEDPYDGWTVHQTDPVWSGDLCLEDESDYVANGFAVRQMSIVKGNRKELIGCHS